jgi:hypothetical protein
MIVPATMGRLAVLPLAAVEWALVAWYVLYWDLFPKHSLRRLIPWAILILSVLGILILQIFIYKQITGVRQVSDDVFKVMLAAENFIGGFVLLYLLNRRKRRPAADRK